MTLGWVTNYDSANSGAVHSLVLHSKAYGIGDRIYLFSWIA